MRVWRARASYRPIGKVSTWLFQIAKNYWFNEREKQKRRPFHAVVGGEAGHEQWNRVADPAGESSPAAVASAHEVQTAIERAVTALSEKLRVVFVLARYRGLPYAEMENKGIMLPVVEAHGEYSKPGNFDDLIKITTTCEEIKGPRLVISYVLSRDGETLMTGYTHHVCMSTEGKVMRPPEFLKELINPPEKS